MKLKSLIAVSSLFALAACDSDNDTLLGPTNLGPPAAAQAQVQVLHASPDAPPVNVLVNGSEVLSGVDFKTGSQKLAIPSVAAPHG